MKAKRGNPFLPCYGHKDIAPQRKQYPRLFKDDGYVPLRDQSFNDIPACDCIELNELFGHKRTYISKGCTTGQGQPKDDDQPYRMWPTKVNGRGVCHYCGYLPAWPEMSGERREKWLQLVQEKLGA